jgi:hypothetical protein
MKKRVPKHLQSGWAGAVRSPLGASKADAAQRLVAEDIAVERTKRRHALLSKLDVLRGLDEAEKRMGRLETYVTKPGAPWLGDPLDEAEKRVGHHALGHGETKTGIFWGEQGNDARLSVDGTTGSVGIGSSSKPLAHPVRERMDLVPWNAVLAVAQTMTEGIKTHDEGAWRKLSQRDHVSRALRHLALFLVGDLAEPHLFHAACRTLMALETSEQLPFREGEFDVEKD